MNGCLPETLDPRLAAQQRLRIIGELPLGQLLRLRQLLLEPFGAASVSLEVGRDDTGLAVLSGQIRTSVRALCQRCLEPLDLSLVAAVALAVVDSDASAAQLPEHYAPLLLAPGEALVRVADLVEDELLLALPDHVLHAQTDCAARSGVRLDGPVRTFAALAQLQQDRPTSGAAENT